MWASSWVNPRTRMRPWSAPASHTDTPFPTLPNGTAARGRSARVAVDHDMEGTVHRLRHSNRLCPSPSMSTCSPCRTRGVRRSPHATPCRRGGYRPSHTRSRCVVPSEVLDRHADPRTAWVPIDQTGTGFSWKLNRSNSLPSWRLVPLLDLLEFLQVEAKVLRVRHAVAVDAGEQGLVSLPRQYAPRGGQQFE
jgi:hypothetical protein